MTQAFHKHLLSELHMVSYEPGTPERGSDRLLCEALTLNENLASLGYTLRPDDIVRLSVSGSLYGFYDHMRTLVPEVKAQPMYPGFPQQVMEISEAEFRLHQMLHYFSTYGIECLTGMQVSKGWLPESGEYTRDRSDITMLESKVIELVPEREAPRVVLERLLQRRERLTNPELELVLESANLCEPEQLKGIRVRFKENLDLLFPLLMQGADRTVALETLRAVCSHAGDALRCGTNYLHQRRWHLKTREKKLLVRLLESYPPRNLKDNLMLSLKARERNLMLLQYLDYNRFSRSAEHRETVRALRNGELLSWQGIGEKMLRERDPEALRYFAARPGYLVRMLNRLLTLGYSDEAILGVLLPAAGSISAHLLVKTAGALTRWKQKLWEDHCRAVDECRAKYEQERNPYLDLWSIRAEANQKRNEARRRWLEEPEREIVSRIDAPLNDLRNKLQQKKKELNARKRLLVQIEAQKRNNGYCRLVRNANSDWDPEIFRGMQEEGFEKNLREETERLEGELAVLRLQVRECLKACDMERRKQIAEMKERNTPAYEAVLGECDAYEEAETEKAKAKYERDLEAMRKGMKTLEARRSAELVKLEATYREQLNKPRHDEETVGILRKVLKEHFRQAVTPLCGRKVFLNLDQFDLAQSKLETDNRSKYGGYIPSGICFRIPEEASIVRFFVYWNDSKRVDIDLHANGATTGGETLHIGWNADFRNSGVLHSGDITHSDAAEYIDIDLSAPIREINANIHLFSGERTFRQVETCYVGLMAIHDAGQDVKHYDPKNCFFTHELTQRVDAMQYGRIDVQNRCVRFVGQPVTWDGWETSGAGEDRPAFPLQDYLDCLLEAQNAEVVAAPSEADLVLTMGKSSRDNAVSLVDQNFFLES